VWITLNKKSGFKKREVCIAVADLRMRAKENRDMIDRTSTNKGGRRKKREEKSI